MDFLSCAKTNSRSDLISWHAPKVTKLATEKTRGGLNGHPETGGCAFIESAG